ncbi:MAG: histidine kinase [Acidimicrobiales bacterium]
MPAALVGFIVLIVAFFGHIPRRELVVPLVLVASAGWLLELVGVHVPLGARAVVTLGALAAINLGADRFGWDDPDGHVQIALMLVLVLVGETVAKGAMPLAVAVVAGAAVITASPLVAGQDGEEHVWSIALLMSVVVGVFLRALLRALAEVEAAQAERTAQAAIDERHRIAREVHDVIAHSLTVTMLHITAARLAVNRGDADDATEALEEAERAGRQSLSEVRRTVGLLRQAGADGSGRARPAPLASDLAALVGEYRSAGLEVDLRVAGDTDVVVPQVGLALYRIIQESLANVARHTDGARATVVIDADDLRRVRVRVRDTGGTPVQARGGGSGLVGMRERAEALGGSCTAGVDGGGWLVEAVLPASALATEVSS